MADTPALTLAGYLRVDEDAVTALCERVARTWVERMLDDAGVPVPEGVDADELQLAILTVGADQRTRRKDLTGQGTPATPETLTAAISRDAKASARAILGDYLGLGIA